MLTKILNREPVLIIGALHAVLTAAVVFGFHFTVDQIAAIEVAATAVLALVARSQVSPVAASPTPSEPPAAVPPAPPAP